MRGGWGGAGGEISRNTKTQTESNRHRRHTQYVPLEAERHTTRRYKERQRETERKKGQGSKMTPAAAAALDVGHAAKTGRGSFQPSRDSPASVFACPNLLDSKSLQRAQAIENKSKSK